MSDNFATPLDGSLPGSSVCGISQARILEWVASEILIEDTRLLLNGKMFQASALRLLLLLRVCWGLSVYLFKCLSVFLDFSLNPFLINSSVLSYYPVILWEAQLYLAFHSYFHFDYLHFCYSIYANG